MKEKEAVKVNKVSWLISESTITVNFDGQTHMLPRTDHYASLLIKALKEKDFAAVPELVSAAKRIEKFSHGKFQVRDGEILIDGEVAPPVLGKKIKDFADNGLPYEPLIKFAQKLQCNVSKRALDHLYEFLEKHNYTITEAGNFIAYKKINANFTDKHTGTFDNSPGQVLKMPRNKVDEDPDSYCSRGFHCSNWQYQADFGSGITVEVEVDPKNVVAIPRDALGAKMRVCEYKVLRVVEEQGDEHLRKTDSDGFECLTCEDERCYDDHCLSCCECDITESDGE